MLPLSKLIDVNVIYQNCQDHRTVSVNVISDTPLKLKSDWLFSNDVMGLPSELSLLCFY